MAGIGISAENANFLDIAFLRGIFSVYLGVPSVYPSFFVSRHGVRRGRYIYPPFRGGLYVPPVPTRKFFGVLKMQTNWLGRILFFMRDGKWRSHRQIKKALGLNQIRNNPDDFMLGSAVSGYLLRLVRHGYLERALAPDILKHDKLDGVKYVYRITGKPYTYDAKKAVYNRRKQLLKSRSSE